MHFTINSACVYGARTGKKVTGRMYSDKLVKQSLSDLQFMLDSRCSAQLNDSQLSALRDALGPSPITLIQGPPGTGKVRLRVTGGSCVVLRPLPGVLTLELWVPIFLFRQKPRTVWSLR
jgi:hypothetical protein